MNFDQKFIYSIFFKNELIQSSGDAFQQIFNRLMINKFDNFQKIEVQGSIGDRKCDGFLKGNGIFFQVYGPKDYNMNATTQTLAISKLEEDFLGLKKHIDSGYWEKIKSYIFVLKSHRGSYPELIEKIKELELKYKDIKFEIYDIDHLIKIFQKLDDDLITIVANTYISEPDFSNVNYQILGSIMKHLMALGHTQNIDVTKTPPDFEEKVKFNNICEFFGSNLKIASYSLHQLDDFLTSYGDPEIADYLCNIFKKLYCSAKANYPDDSNLQFKYILDSCRTSEVPNNQIQSFETNSYVMMSKYFETCDIFEEPK